MSGDNFLKSLPIGCFTEADSSRLHKLQCCICRDVCENPVLLCTVGKHFMCLVCLRSFLDSNVGQYCRCPMCNRTLAVNNISTTVDIDADATIGNCDILCPNHENGCPWTGKTYNYWNIHYAECNFHHCPNRHCCNFQDRIIRVKLHFATCGRPSSSVASVVDLTDSPPSSNSSRSGSTMAVSSVRSIRPSPAVSQSSGTSDSSDDGDVPAVLPPPANSGTNTNPPAPAAASSAAAALDRRPDADDDDITAGMPFPLFSGGTAGRNGTAAVRAAASTREAPAMTPERTQATNRRRMETPNRNGAMRMRVGNGGRHEWEFVGQFRSSGSSENAQSGLRELSPSEELLVDLLRSNSDRLYPECRFTYVGVTSGVCSSVGQAYVPKVSQGSCDHHGCARLMRIVRSPHNTLMLEERVKGRDDIFCSDVARLAQGDNDGNRRGRGGSQGGDRRGRSSRRASMAGSSRSSSAPLMPRSGRSSSAPPPLSRRTMSSTTHLRRSSSSASARTELTIQRNAVLRLRRSSALPSSHPNCTLLERIAKTILKRMACLHNDDVLSIRVVDRRLTILFRLHKLIQNKVLFRIKEDNLDDLEQINGIGEGLRELIKDHLDNEELPQEHDYISSI